MRTILAVLLALPVLAGENLLENGDLAEWKDGLPAGWTTEKGAGAPSGKESEIVKGEDGGVQLGGDASTAVWRSVSQDVAARGGAYYRLTYEARATGLKVERGQFDNAWVGLAAMTDEGKTATRIFDTMTSEDWTAFEILLPRAATAKLRVTAFLSKTGRMEARRFVLEEMKPADSGDVLLRQVGRYYSYFDLKKLDWPAMVKRHRGKLEGAADAEAFAIAVRDFLAELKDPHVHFFKPDGSRVETFERTWERNYDYKWVGKQVKSPVQIGKIAFAGTTGDGFGVVAIGSLVLDDATAAKIVAEIDARLDAPGFIVDLRGNSGGAEKRGMEFASIFADQERVYALSSYRDGPKPADLTPPFERRIAPRKGKTFTKPVVVLIGPGCISSGEGFVKAMKCLPHVTLVGLATAGASGNPAPIELPNGVTVWFSRWVDMLPDGISTEGKGIAPDVEVKQEGAGDAAFLKAVEILKEKTKK
ncbi:MAG: S41 family peptidase [Planctomycetota bacterium]